MDKPQSENAGIFAAVTARAVSTLRRSRGSAGEGTAGERTASAFSGMSSVQELNDFITATGKPWYHGGGYAMLQWCLHYGLEAVETRDLDIFVLGTDEHAAVHLALFGVAPEQLGTKPPLGGYEVSLLSARGEPERFLIDGVPVVSPLVLARNYQRSPFDEIKRRNQDADTESDEGKQQRRARRAGVMPELLKMFNADISSGALTPM
ncbi:hypothetical protein ACFPM7_09300 [Actinokineospora guangxiensis]|uniref:Nucleotidyltransferase-like protein n=1 Tax=Actinokineospora guangxiensis TaxID=1490288 RepID=A0ABW0EIJ3_9PSEU